MHAAVQERLRRRWSRRGFLTEIAAGSIPLGVLAACGRAPVVTVTPGGASESRSAQTVAPAASTITSALSAARPVASATSSGVGATTPVEFWTWWNPPDVKGVADYYRQVFGKVGSSQRSIAVQMVNPAFGQYETKFYAAVAAGTGPDVAHVSVAWGRDLWGKGTLEELSPLIGRTPAVALEDFVASSLIYNQTAGKVYGLPMEGPSSNVLWYNAALFQNVGLDPAVAAVNRWTWGDFLTNAAKLTRRTGSTITIAGFDGLAANVNNLATLVQSNGASMYDAQQTAVGWNNEAGIETLQLIADINRGTWPGTATWATGQKPPDTKNGRVFDGTVAMQFGGTFQVEFLESGASALDLRTALMPRGPHGTTNSSVSFTNMVTLPTGSKHPDAAWAFASYFAGLEARTICLQTTQRAEQPRKDFFASQAFAAMAQKFPDLQDVPRYGALGGAYPFIEPTAVANAVNPVLAEAAAGKLSATDAIGRAARLADRILQQSS